MCLWSVFFALVLNEECGMLGWLEWWWLGAIYSPNHYSSRCCRWRTGQSGGALDRALFTVKCVPHQHTVGVWSSRSLTSSVLVVHLTVRCYLTSQTVSDVLNP